MMSLDENKELVRRWYAEVNRGNASASAIVVSDDYQMNGMSLGPAGAEGVTRMLLAAFPDWNGTIEDMIAEGDRVAVRTTYRGTHRGDFQGIAATGNAITLKTIEICRISNGKITQLWTQPDRLGLMQQLGMLPTSR
jgi:steroid delta-isomerase-like uncharacterized protein